MSTPKKLPCPIMVAVIGMICTIAGTFLLRDFWEIALPCILVGCATLAYVLWYERRQRQQRT